MPIYEYRCANCGFEKEYLQKISDPPVTECPNCGQSAMAKKVTAAGFQLKGTGWYVTDFKNKSGGGKPAAGEKKSEGDSAKTEGKSDSATDSKSDKPADAKSSTSGTKSDSASSSGSGKPAAGT